MQTFEAIQLFLDRIQSVSPEFAITRENAGAVAQISRRLDGIPLALINLGSLWLDQDNLTAAIHYYREAIEQIPSLDEKSSAAYAAVRAEGYQNR